MHIAYRPSIFNTMKTTIARPRPPPNSQTKKAQPAAAMGSTVAKSNINTSLRSITTRDQSSEGKPHTNYCSSPNPYLIVITNGETNITGRCCNN